MIFKRRAGFLIPAACFLLAAWVWGCGVEDTGSVITDGDAGSDIQIDNGADWDGIPPSDMEVPDTAQDETSDASPPPPDADNDGLPDDDELARGTDPHDEDSDDDGLGDGVEVLAGTNPLDPGSVIPPTDYYVVLPYQDPPQLRELDFTARLGKGDIFFMVDTTGSMMPAIRNVRTSLSTIIVPAVNAAIADVLMGVGDYRDFPTGGYGDAGDWTFQLRQAMTVDVGAVQLALDGLAAAGGGDTPEAMLEGLFTSVTGDCGVDAFGAPCFRTGSHPIIVVVTDAPTHNGPGGEYDYDATVTARTWTETIDALGARSVKIVGAAVRLFGLAPARADLEALAGATGSYSADGALTVYVAPTGNVSDAVVSGIVDLVGAETQDVTSRKIDDPSDAVDATLFIKAIRPIRASRATSFDDTTFYGVAGGTTITFEITFQNDFLPEQAYVQIFKAQIEIHNLPDMTPLDLRNVYIVVPAEGGLLI
jgi:hypothetical protein